MLTQVEITEEVESLIAKLISLRTPKAASERRVVRLKRAAASQLTEVDKALILKEAQSRGVTAANALSRKLSSERALAAAEQFPLPKGPITSLTKRHLIKEALLVGFTALVARAEKESK